MPKPKPNLNSASRERVHRGTRWLMLVFGLWAILIASGSYLFGATADIRKPILIILAATLFLATWIGIARHRRRPPKARRHP